MEWTAIPGVVCEGYGVASGVRGAFPGGTIRAQIPLFGKRGLDLSHCYPGTLNVSVAPLALVLVHPAYTFRGVRWASNHAAEDFSFSACRISCGDVVEEGFIYHPHPETKPQHFQPPSIVEVMAPFIEGLAYGSSVIVDINPAEVHVAEEPSGSRS